MEFNMEHETAQIRVLSQFSNYAQDIEILIIRVSAPWSVLLGLINGDGELEFEHASDTESDAVRAGTWGGRVPPTFKLPRDVAKDVLAALIQEMEY